jgi:hypothetical protein
MLRLGAFAPNAAHAYSLDMAMTMCARIRRLDQVAAMLRE